MLITAFDLDGIRNGRYIFKNTVNTASALVLQSREKCDIILVRDKNSHLKETTISSVKSPPLLIVY